MINFFCLKMTNICNIILSYLEENQKPFWAQWYVDGRKRKKIFSIIFTATCIFWHRSSHKYQEPEVLSTEDWFIFKFSKCDFWISHLKKLTHTKFQDERMSRTTVIIENINSKWWILPWNTHFSQIFKSQ